MANKCPEDPIFGQVEMDSHADTCVLGKNFIILHSTGRECDVYPYTDSYDGIKGVQIVTGATSWTCHMRHYGCQIRWRIAWLTQTSFAHLEQRYKIILLAVP
jgi:hypothetical protein